MDLFPYFLASTTPSTESHPGKNWSAYEKVYDVYGELGNEPSPV